MELYQLTYLKEIYEKLSFTRAAEALEHSPSALTIAIQKLEAELNTPLFLKKGRVIEPSPACTRLLPLIDRALRDLQRLSNAAADLPVYTNTVNLGIPDLIYGTDLPQMKQHFADLGISVNLRQESEQQALEESLRTGKLDLAILRVLANQKKNFQSVTWREEEYCACVAQDSPYASLPCITPEIMARSPLILSREMNDLRHIVDEYLAAFRLSSEGMLADSVSLYSAYSLVGFHEGICIVPRVQPKASNMKIIPIFPVLKAELVVALSPVSEESLAVEAVKEYILADQLIPAPAYRAARQG